MQINQKLSTKEYELAPVFKKNSFQDYFKNLAVEKKPINAVKQIVKIFFELRKLDKMPKEFYSGRWAYPKMAREAKSLLTMCKGNEEDALWCLSKMNHIAETKNFEWSIITCLKYDLIKN